MMLGILQFSSVELPVMVSDLLKGRMADQFGKERTGRYPPQHVEGAVQGFGVYGALGVEGGQWGEYFRQQGG